MRKRLGKITYVKDEQIADTPENEILRQDILKAWRRENAIKKSKAHLKRITREDQLAQSIMQIFDKSGLPPRNVNISSLVHMYNRLENQKGWIIGINAEIRLRLKKLNTARYFRELEVKRKEMRENRARRDANFLSVVTDQSTRETLPPKVRAAILEALAMEIDRHTAKLELGGVTMSHFDISRSRQISKMMKYLFFDYIQEDAKGISHDLLSQYNFLNQGLQEFEAFAGDIKKNMYDIQEFIESADMIVMNNQ